MSIFGGRNSLIQAAVYRKLFSLLSRSGAQRTGENATLQMVQVTSFKRGQSEVKRKYQTSQK